MSKQQRITKTTRPLTGKMKQVEPLLQEAILHQRRIRVLVEQIERILVEKIKDPECFAYELITDYIIEIAYEDGSENSLVHAKELVMRTSR